VSPMSEHVTVAVVGAGMAGQAHAFGYRNATMHPDIAGVDVRLSTIVDFSQDLARSVADRYGFATATTDLDAVLQDDAIDGVSLALPNFAYAEVIPQLVAAGKHVLAEKPLGRSAAEAHQFATAADRPCSPARPSSTRPTSRKSPDTPHAARADATDQPRLSLGGSPEAGDPRNTGDGHRC
jgi:Oxidoreductase family, NAD-binding Rossmann fold